MSVLWYGMEIKRPRINIGAWYVYNIMVILQTPKSLHATTNCYCYYFSSGHKYAYFFVNKTNF